MSTRSGNKVSWRAYVKHAGSKALRAKAKRQLRWALVVEAQVEPAKAKTVLKYHWILSEE